ncbi:hypothetical protein EYC08_04955 [Tabrizicola sp. WMC-M-20]|nr:hypothetical protein EYC08_04955 [Tabrizicola sp. WMC-M-20]
MMGASKILTVSYGTFSCTLEGFEDPFNTMKAIAEYFRDLAAGDRYFGAEPPQPDAAMLHKIAEREIQRRVEAKVQENGVILRAEEPGTAAAPAHSASVAAQVAPQPVVEMPARGTAPVPRPAPTLAGVETEASTGAEPAAGTVAEKLSRLRKAAAESREATPVVTLAVPLALAQDDFTYDFTEDQHADATPLTDLAAFEDVLPEDAVTVDAQILTDDLPPEEQSIEADEVPDDLPVDAPIAHAPPAVPAEDDAEDWVDEDDLADLMALDAVAHVDAGPQDAAPAELPDGADDLSEPEMVEASDEVARSATPAEFADGESFDEDIFASVLAETAAPDEAVTPEAPDMARSSAMAEAEADDALLASLGTLVDAQAARAEAAPEAEPVADAGSQDDAVTELVATVDVYDDDADDTAALAGAAFEAQAAATHETAFEPELEAEEDDALLQPLSDVADEAAATDLTSADAPEADLADDDAQADAAAPDTAPAVVAPVRPIRPVRPLRPTVGARPAVPELASDFAAEAESRTPVSIEKLQRARARVIKIRRVDAPVARLTAVPAPAALSQEAEAALTAELAALEREPHAEASDAAAAGLAQAGAIGHHLDRPAEEVAVSRLMAEASTQMEVPDTKRRRSAIAHLKAAVAATIAERRATGSTLAENGRARMGAYRDDLAKVMRPTAAAPAPQGERPAPLVLVSAQRIDRPADVSRAPAAAAVVPVRPRRPMSSAALAIEAVADDAYDAEQDADNLFEADIGFPDFAERLGATDLPELLEAAAAYIACVEGLDSFTRPQLMRHIGAATEGVSREDGLRSFGILLREGVIERSRRGQFAISDASPLLAHARKIAG